MTSAIMRVKVWVGAVAESSSWVAVLSAFTKWLKKIPLQLTFLKIAVNRGFLRYSGTVI